MDKVINENEFRIFGLRRGGNHAIIAWIASSYPDNSVYYFNDVSHSYSNLFESELTGPSNQLAGTVAAKMISCPLATADKKCIIQSYEDNFLELILEIDKQEIGQSKNRVNIVVLRDPLNMIASRLELYRIGNPYVEVTKEIIDLWCEYAEQYLRFLEKKETILDTNSTKTIFINYNHWVESKEYRDMIASAIGINPATANHHSRMLYGGGSSFKSSDSSNVNLRWKKYENDPVFMRWANDPRIIKYNEKLFGFTK
jgi:hypothetical protein